MWSVEISRMLWYVMLRDLTLERWAIRSCDLSHAPVPLPPCRAVVEHLLFFLNVPKLPSYFNANLRWQRVARLALSSKSWKLILLVQTWAIVCGNGPAETENEKLVEKVEEVLPEIGERPRLTNCCRFGTKRVNAIWSVYVEQLWSREPDPRKCQAVTASEGYSGIYFCLDRTAEKR